MDSFGLGGAYQADEAAAAPSHDDVVSAIGGDERRMHVRAYNYWVSLLGGRDFPSIEDLQPESVADFAPHSVLLDFTAGRGNPATPYIGTAIRAECGLTGDVGSIAGVPSRSLLSRLTDHYLQIIANRAPIGFEAEFVNQIGHSICYRGILMPFSSDGDTIDFIYGVINWKDASGQVGLPDMDAEPLELTETLPVAAVSPDIDAVHPAWEDGPLNDDDAIASPVLDADAGLHDRLSAARDGAEVCKQQDGRTRAALYRALDMAYDFAVAARRANEDYLEILEDAGVKAQARAPMTPIVKLVFGIDYDKTRLTEFAAALSFAERCGVDFGGFLAFIERQPGGLKALVAGERQARRPGLRPDARGEIARTALRTRPSLSLAALPTNAEFALVLTRRNAAGVHEIVSLVTDGAMLERAVRKAA
ncbi:hypothetical protein [Sphingomonas sp.]|uniref:PAS domain-containing protein n=1 Tax=Sphingomonas sp. TaxID=28214 RepID=UPI00286C05D5|nr:hypothetical protein [Sphingomonas sp.]